MIRSLILLAFAYRLATAAYAGESAQWTLKLGQATETSESEVSLVLIATVRENWHVYGRAGGAEGQQPLELLLKLPVGIEAVGDWVWPKAETIYEGREIEIYTGTQTFTRKLKVTTATGEVKIRVIVSYQACTHELCGPPEEEELTTILKIAEDKPPPAKKP